MIEAKPDREETPRAAAAFAEYCGLGVDRSLAKLAQKVGKSKGYVGQLERWSSHYHWQERVKEYDRAVIDKAADARRKEFDADIEAMNKRHIDIALNLQLALVEKLDAIKDDFTASSWIAAMRLATELERLARGEPTQVTAMQGPGGQPLEGFRAVFVFPKVEEVARGADHTITGHPSTTG